MESKNTDLSALRINRANDTFGAPPKRKVWVVLVFIVCVALLAYGAFSLYNRVMTPALEVRLSSAAWSSPSQSNAVLTASGYVVAQRKASVASKATGRLEFLGVVEGDRVMQGEIIARIEDADLKASLNQARANLRVYEAELKDARQSLGRQKALLEKALTTQAEYDAAEARYDRTLASIEAAKAAVTGAEVALENTLIRAPFDGTVLTKNADIGEMVVPMAASVGSRAAVVTLADMSSLQVEADVSESNIERVIINQPCEITLDAYPDFRYQGYVKKIVPTADRAKATVMVKVAFKSYDSRVLPEMSAKVLFLGQGSSAAQQQAKSLLTIPASAVAKRNGNAVVYIVRENKAVEVPVVLGKELGLLIEVKGGVTAGDKVISTITAQLVNGVAVKVQ
ncbi:MAG: efflux RND transporter periplasmic adaptor subunit [bacterium]